MKTISPFKQIIVLTALLGLTLHSNAATVYTRVNAKPSAGWPGTYLIVYEKSETEAIIWNGEDASGNTVKANIKEGKIVSEELSDYQVVVSQEGNNRYYVKAKDGYIGANAKQNSLEFSNGGKECTLSVNGTYTMLETNTSTCRFLCYETSKNNYRFRFYYDKDKKWADSDKHNIHFYALGDVELEEPQNQLDINYAHVEMYACESKFPTQNNPYDQYFTTFMFLAQEESDDAVPQIGLEILAPTQYSIEGSYKSDYQSGKKYFINCQAGAKHSYFIFPSKAEQGWSEAAINLAEMKITKAGASNEPNAYKYHIYLVFTDSNKKIWTLNKDIDVYAWWIDCNRSGETNTNMEPVPFVLESGNHNPQSENQSIDDIQSGDIQCTKVVRDGKVYILRGDKTYTLQGQEIKQR